MSPLLRRPNPKRVAETGVELNAVLPRRARGPCQRATVGGTPGPGARRGGRGPHPPAAAPRAHRRGDRRQGGRRRATPAPIWPPLLGNGPPRRPSASAGMRPLAPWRPVATPVGTEPIDGPLAVQGLAAAVGPPPTEGSQALRHAWRSSSCPSSSSPSAPSTAPSPPPSCRWADGRQRPLRHGLPGPHRCRRGPWSPATRADRDRAAVVGGRRARGRGPRRPTSPPPSASRASASPIPTAGRSSTASTCLCQPGRRSPSSARTASKTTLVSSRTPG